jgi:hypothetical protein
VTQQLIKPEIPFGFAQGRLSRAVWLTFTSSYHAHCSETKNVMTIGPWDSSLRFAPFRMTASFLPLGFVVRGYLKLRMTDQLNSYG